MKIDNIIENAVKAVINEYTDSDFSGAKLISDVMANKPDNESMEFITKYFPNAVKSMSTAQGNLKASDASPMKKRMGRYAPMFIHVQYNKFEDDANQVFAVHQKQYYNSNFKDKPGGEKFNPQVTKLAFMGGDDQKDNMGEILVVTDEYIKDLSKLRSQGKLDKTVSESVNEELIDEAIGIPTLVVLGAVLGVMGRVAFLPDAKMQKLVNTVKGATDSAKAVAGGLKKVGHDLLRKMPGLGPKLKDRDDKARALKAVSEYLTEKIDDQDLLRMFLKDPVLGELLIDIAKGGNQYQEFYSRIKKLTDRYVVPQKLIDLRKKLKAGDIKLPDTQAPINEGFEWWQPLLGIAGGVGLMATAIFSIIGPSALVSGSFMGGDSWGDVLRHYKKKFKDKKAAKKLKKEDVLELINLIQTNIDSSDLEVGVKRYMKGLMNKVEKELNKGEDEVDKNKLLVLLRDVENYAKRNKVKLPSDLKESIKEGAMSDIHMLAQEASTIEEFIKEFMADYGDKFAGASKPKLDKWLADLYTDAKAMKESKLNENRGQDEATDLILKLERNLYTKLSDLELDAFKKEMAQHFGSAMNESTTSSKTESITKRLKEDTEYQEFFKSTMHKFGVKSPKELKGKKKDEFFNYVDKNYKAKSE